MGLTQLDGRTIRYVFSGDTIIERAYWGSQALAFSWLRYVGELKREQPEMPLFWFLIVKGHRTFRYLPTFAREFYPHWEHGTPDSIAALMRKLAEERFGDAFDAASGLIRYPESHGHLAEDLAEANEREAAREDVSFFLRRNPGYRNGHELVCLCELSKENLRPLARRVFDGGSAHVKAWATISAAATRERGALLAALAAPERQQPRLLQIHPLRQSRDALRRTARLREDHAGGGLSARGAGTPRRGIRAVDRASGRRRAKRC